MQKEIEVQFLDPVYFDEGGGYRGISLKSVCGYFWLEKRTINKGWNVRICPDMVWGAEFVPSYYLVSKTSSIFDNLTEAKAACNLHLNKLLKQFSMHSVPSLEDKRFSCS
jgi:hypothetical protein